MARRNSLPLLCLAGLFALVGCSSDGNFTLLGYTTKPPFDTSIRTVYVPIFGNETYLRGLELQITREVGIQIESRTPYKLAGNCADADTILEGVIKHRRKTPNNLNQLGEVRDVEVGLVVEVRWKNLRTGEILSMPNGMRRPDPALMPIPNPNAPPDPWFQITPSASYVPELGGSTASGLDAVSKQVARQITHLMESWEANCVK